MSPDFDVIFYSNLTYVIKWINDPDSKATEFGALD